MSEEKQNKAPVVFAGAKFYELVLGAMAKSQEAALRNDFHSWITVLRQINNWLSGFVTDKTIASDLATLHRRVEGVVAASKDRNYARFAPGELIKIREELILVEGRLFNDVKEFFLKLGGDDNLSWNPDELKGLMG